MGGSVGQWMGLGQSTKNLINLHLIKIIHFCLNTYDLLDILDILLKPPQPLMGLFLLNKLTNLFGDNLQNRSIFARQPK